MRFHGYFNVVVISILDHEGSSRAVHSGVFHEVEEVVEDTARSDGESGVDQELDDNGPHSYLVPLPRCPELLCSLANFIESDLAVPVVVEKSHDLRNGGL